MNKLYKRIRNLCLTTMALTSMVGASIAQCTTEIAPWFYDVETAASTTNSSIADCWSSSPNSTSSAFRWDVGSSTPSVSTGPSSAYSGSKFFYTEASSGSNGAVAYLNTPAIDLSALSVPQLGFYYHMYGSDINTLNVQVSTDNGVTWTTEATIFGEQQSSGSEAWKEELVLLNSYTGIVSIRFEAIRGTSFNGDISIDDISVVEAPTCIKPSALSASNITTTNADLSWTDNNGSTAWDVEWGTNGFVLGTGTPVNATTSNPLSITIAPLSSYEFYVRAICTPGDSSNWAGPYFFSNDYCQFTVTSTSPQHIVSFSTSGAIVDINNPNSGAGTTSVGYSDFSSIVMDAYETQTIDFNLTTSNTSTYGILVYVDWDNNYAFDNTELVYTSNGYTSAPFDGSFIIPTGQAIGNYRMRVVADYLNGGSACGGNSAEAEDYTINVIAPPSCLPPMNIDTVSVTTNSVLLEWDEINATAATSWNIEYGPSGFTPGSPAGTMVPASTNPFTISGLSPSTNYDFYVQASCSSTDSSAWRGPYSVYTACGIAIAPYYEGFNNGVQPQCWENLSSDPSVSINNFWNFNQQGDYGAGNNGRSAGEFTKVDGNSPYSDSVMLITPEIDISQLATPYLSFEWFSNNTNNPGDNVPLIIEVFDGTTWNYLDTLKGDSPEWEFVNYDLSAYSNNIIKVRFMVNKSVTTSYSYYNDILLDEIRIDDCISLGGIDGLFDICRLDNTVDLNNNIITKPNGGGEWSFPGQPNFLSDSIFTVTYLPSGSYEVYYVERFVCYDTTVATINVFNPSSAGTDGADTVCKNEPIDLFASIGGNVDLGGKWYDFTNTLLPNALPKAQGIPGQYNYYYIADNGVCPADTAIVNVTVLSECDFLSLGEELFTDISVYPNPATSQVSITNPSNTASLKVEMLDMNGRVVLVENKALNNASEATLAIDHLERGVYTLRVYNNEGQKTFKIVKQ